MSFKYKIAFNGEYDNVCITQIKSIAIFEQLFGKDTPRLVFDINDVACPEDPTHRYIQAWRFDDDDNPTKIVINMDVVREMFMKRARCVRDAYVVGWDEEHNIAQWTNKKKRATEINKVKQRLRDLPQDIESDVVAAESIAELHTVSHPSLITDRPPKLVGQPIPLNV